MYVLNMIVTSSITKIDDYQHSVNVIVVFDSLSSGKMNI